MKKLNVGIIGLGVGERHLEAYAAHGRVGSITVCDFDKNKVRQVQKKYPAVKAARDANEILTDQDIHAVSIASYDNHHTEQVLKGIKFDKHLFVEKPVCLKPKDAKRIHQALNAKPHLKFTSNLILRQSPRFQWLKEMIQSGQLGEIYYMEGDYNYGRIEKLTQGWRGDLDYYSMTCGGGVHMIDLLLWLTKGRVKEVTAFGNNIATKGSKFRYNDMVASLLKFDNGAIAKMSVNGGCVHPHYHHLSVYGTKATFVNGPEHGLLYSSRDPAKKPLKIKSAYPGAHKGGLVDDFIDSIVKDKTPAVTVEDIFNAMSICFAIEKSVNSKRLFKTVFSV